MERQTEMSRLEKMTAWLDLLAMTALILSYMWIWQGSFPGDAVVCGALLMLLAIWSHRRRRDTARDLGLRFDNLGPALVSVFAIVGPLIAMVLLLGVGWGTHGDLSATDIVLGTAMLVVVGVVQQYGLVGFYFRRFRELLPGSWIPVVLTASVFALLHLPNPFLVALTFAVGVGAAWLYVRAQNILALGIAHGLLSAAILFSLPETLTLGMQVGQEALR